MAIYLLVIAWILLFKLGVRFSYMETRSMNLIPFKEPLILNGEPDFGEVILNVIIFVPLGIYTGILFAKWVFRKKLLFFFLSSFLVEALQFILAIGAFDSTDILTNTLGGLIGLYLFKIVEIGFGNKLRAQKFVNLIAGIGTAAILLLLVLLKLDMLPIRYR